jgi:PAS domain S-box-containing protein
VDEFFDSNAPLQRALSAGGIGSWDIDLCERQITINAQEAVILGLAPGPRELSLHDFTALIHPDDLSWVSQQYWSAGRNSEEIKVEFRIIRPDGEIRWLEGLGGFLRDEAGILRRILGIHVDITERKRMEAEIRHADRISILGKVSAGIAHEVGNPLASITTRLALLTDCNDLEELKQGLQPLEEQVSRINRIVRGVSQIARPKQGRWTVFDLRKAIHDTLNVVRLHRLAKKFEIVYHPSEKPMRVSGVEDQIEQVFLNLCLNAMEAMPGGGKLQIICSYAKGQWTLQFIDTGVGMSREHCGRIFDLFFTTKTNGLGIGMHIVYQIITVHGGEISVESGVGDGSNFTVTLPEATETENTLVA